MKILPRVPTTLEVYRNGGDPKFVEGALISALAWLALATGNILTTAVQKPDKIKS